jgi:hypothetical protein
MCEGKSHVLETEAGNKTGDPMATSCGPKTAQICTIGCSLCCGEDELVRIYNDGQKAPLQATGASGAQIITRRLPAIIELGQCIIVLGGEFEVSSSLGIIPRKASTVFKAKCRIELG